MNGPQHYAEAERLLVGRAVPNSNRRAPTDADIAAAQVHATLALAAATALTLDPLGPAAGDVEDFLALVDRINAALLGWAPVLDGHPFPGPVKRLPGYEAPMLNDASMSPPRAYALLQYQTTI